MGEVEKRYFHQLMRRLEQFSGVQVVTYCLMENHFHMLVRVPQSDSQAVLTEARLRELLPLIYERRELKDALLEVDRAAQDSSEQWMREILARYQARRFSLSIFLKELKQRYTRWHNRRHNRVGTLWENRFRSVLVEGDETALMTIAAYIDLNPVRAGIVNDPKEYHWSGYAEAIGGRKAARSGLCAILNHTSFGINRRCTWRSTAPRYRLLLYGHGEARSADAKSGKAGRLGISRDEALKVIDNGGELELSEILRCKVRYLTDGMAIGSEEFLDEIFRENRSRFSKARQDAGRFMRGSNWRGLQTLRGLQSKVFG